MIIHCLASIPLPLDNDNGVSLSSTGCADGGSEMVREVGVDGNCVVCDGMVGADITVVGCSVVTGRGG
jgi:hypothetical protein